MVNNFKLVIKTNLVDNIDIIYWSVHSFKRRRGDGVKGMDRYFIQYMIHDNLVLKPRNNKSIMLFYLVISNVIIKSKLH